MGKKIGLFGGTFNPIHFGHVALPIEIKEKKELSEVWVLPSALSPLRQHEEHVSKEHRFKMAELAFQEIPGFQILDLELKRPLPSYTLDTVNELLKKFPNEEFFLIMGEDILKNLSQWRGIDELSQKIPFLIGSREGDCFLSKELSEQVQKNICDGKIKTLNFEISATYVRDRLKKGLYCGHLIPAKVLDYIYENQLYFSI